MTNPVVTTRVARADWGENCFRGYRVLAELAGRDGFWAVMSLAVGGPRLSDAEASLLDEVSTCVLAAEPRIWPPKITRLVASYGSTLTAFAAGYLPLEGAFVGPWGAGDAAELLCTVRSDIHDDYEALEADLIGRLASKVRLHGFGVPFRGEDERVVAIAAALERARRSEQPFWALASRMSLVLDRLKRLPINVGGAIAALCLDLGFTPRQIACLSMPFAATAFAANAVEGAEQASAVLRRLPEDAVRYGGVPPRVSDRGSGDGSR
jgi:hypothetical protein